LFHIEAISNKDAEVGKLLFTEQLEFGRGEEGTISDDIKMMMDNATAQIIVGYKCPTCFPYLKSKGWRWKPLLSTFQIIVYAHVLGQDNRTVKKLEIYKAENRFLKIFPYIVGMETGHHINSANKEKVIRGEGAVRGALESIEEMFKRDSTRPYLMMNKRRTP
tara:strand:+ start:296 stop:784 length:489 start_codon:yes stop_codon:yes gene_type:complete